VKRQIERGVAAPIWVVYTGANPDVFSPSKKGLAPGFDVLYVGRVEEYKGVGMLIRAIARLKRDGFRYTCGIIGKGNYVRILEQQLVHFGLLDQVKLVGNVPDVASYMASSRVLTLPSLWQEPLGGVLIEAQACGIPVVASRVGGIPEIVVDGKTGVLLPAGDENALAEALHNLLGNESLRKSMGDNARRHVLCGLTEDITLSKYLQFVEENS